MVSIVIATFNDERRLGGTLAALIQAMVDGLVKQVIVADSGSTDATLAIADDAGATLVEGGLSQGCMAARGPWLLILDAGARLHPGWEKVAYTHMIQSPGTAAWIAPPGGFGGWRGLLVTSPVVIGVLAPKAVLPALAAKDQPADIVKALGRSGATRLDVSAWLDA